MFCVCFQKKKFQAISYKKCVKNKLKNLYIFQKEVQKVTLERHKKKKKNKKKKKKSGFK